MSAVTYVPAQKTAKPVAAGVLNIIVGSFCALGGLGLAVAAAIVASLNAEIPIVLSIPLSFLALPLLAIGAVTIIGGYFAIQRRRWGWALAGSIVAVCVSHVLGIASIILIALSKDEFEK